MKRAIFLILIFSSCCVSKKYWHVTKPTDEREWRAFRWADSAVCNLLGLDSTTYDWNKKIQYDWKNGKSVQHKFKN